jgi:hypothetical protein
MMVKSTITMMLIASLMGIPRNVAANEVQICKCFSSITMLAWRSTDRLCSFRRDPRLKELPGTWTGSKKSLSGYGGLRSIATGDFSGPGEIIQEGS